MCRSIAADFLAISRKCAPGMAVALVTLRVNPRGAAEIYCAPERPSGFALALRRGLFQPEFLHPVADLIPVQPEEGGGLGLVAAGAAERLHDQLPLEGL